jgi:hypothetical protein
MDTFLDTDKQFNTIRTTKIMSRDIEKHKVIKDLFFIYRSVSFLNLYHLNV